MAGVLSNSSSIGLRPRTSKDAPDFGFGLGSSNMHSPAWPSQSSAFNQLASSSIYNNTTHRVHKRRHEPEDSENFPQDEAMDRSPTPDSRPKRAAPKRARTSPIDAVTKDDNVSRDSRSRVSDDQDVDIGVLLATLPPQSLLPILNSLIQSHPSLKSAILPLIPRPTLETATQALAASSKKLRDAYPYSNNSLFPQSDSSAPSFGFGFGFGQPNPSSSSNTGMRDSYVVNRLRPHISEFVSACMSYLPYFSYVPGSSRSALSAQSKAHPTETFVLLCSLTSHVFSQPQLTQTSLEPHLLTRLSEEWKAWVDRIDVVVNQEAGMFGSETVQGWVQRLDEFAAKNSQFGNLMRGVRDQWISRVGWLVGRTIQQPMES